MFQRILLAFDQSEPAKRAITLAVQLARELGGVLAIVHVVDSSQAKTEQAVVHDATLVSLREQGEMLLDAACDAIGPEIAIERFLYLGDPAESILSLAQEWSADLVIIGSNSRGRLAHFLLGSTADSVVRRAPCPVITIRDGIEMGAEDRSLDAAAEI